MFLEDKTLKEFGKSFDQCKWENKIWIKCDFCEKEFTKKKGKYLESQKKCITKKDCCGDYSCRKKKQIESCLQEHGVVSYSQIDSVKEEFGKKIKAKSKEIHEKAKVTNLKKYGVPSYSQTEEFKEKYKNTCLNKHGVSSPMKLKEVKEKQKSTNQERYGVDNVFQREDIKEQIKQHNMETHGVEQYIESEECKLKIKNTSLERYGTEIPIQSDIVREKMQNTCLQKFGTKTPLENEEFRLKCKEIFVEKYGVDTPFSIPEIVEQIKKDMLEKHGVENCSQIPEIREKIRNTIVERYGVDEIFKSDEIREKTKNRCVELYGKYPVNNFGKIQEEILDWLNSSGFIFVENDWDILKNREIDFYCEELKLGIEYCGLFWHNEFSPQPRDKRYHFDKYSRCLDQGIRLITIFEDEWKNRQNQCKNFIKSILKKGKRIYGRNCEVRQITFPILDDFFEKHHIQGKNTLRTVGFGLYFEEELIGAISLGRHHRKKDENIVLDRLCFKDEVQAIGGASKLFKQCVQWCKNNNYNKIVSWSDNRWSQGHIYDVLGFKLTKVLSPDYSYVDVKKSTRLSKQSCRKSNTNCPPEIKEKDWMLQKGFARIWDCGKKHWEYNI